MLFLQALDYSAIIGSGLGLIGAIAAALALWRSNTATSKVSQAEVLFSAWEKITNAQAKQIDTLERRDEARELRILQLEKDIAECREQHAFVKGQMQGITQSLRTNEND